MREAWMKAKMERPAGKIEDEATVEIVAKAEAHAEPAAGAVPGSETPEYTLRDDAGHEETVDTRDFKVLP
jgi:hypothetical protein